eukprot:TRINITY_DN2661_c0_g1_i1.p1 TRINITY_DN2661_c0_g1~~TRINITY_DN2661_c0_g1_i1.p1  ORF type:complete len:846 (-),score=182.26 TRINITY_DN2661_c0_g1_i1:4-2256(-)
MKNADKYVVVPYTLKDGQLGTYELEISSDNDQLKVIEPKEFQRRYDISDEWFSATAGGSSEFLFNNPQFYLDTPKALTCYIIITILNNNEEMKSNVGLFILRPKDMKPILDNEVMEDQSQVIYKPNFVSEYKSGVVIPLSTLENDKLVLIPCTESAGCFAEFKITVLSNSRLKLAAFANTCHKIKLLGSWENDRCGGCLNFATWRNNPQYMLYVHEKVPINIRIKQTKGEKHKIGFYVALNEYNTSKVMVLTTDNLVAKSNFSSKSLVKARMELEPKGNNPYVLIPVCFNPGESGDFEIDITIMSIHSSNPKAALQVYPSTVTWYSLRFDGAWNHKLSGGCKNNETTWLKNPQFNFKVLTECTTYILLKLEGDSTESVGFYVVSDQRILHHTSELKEEDLKHTNLVSKTDFVNRNEAYIIAKYPTGTYKIIPTTYSPGIHKKFSIYVYCDSKFSLIKAESVDNLKDKFSKSRTAEWEMDEYSLDVNNAKIIGKGGYGIVYHSVYKGKEVALKKVNPKLVTNSERLTLRKEIEIMALYKHPCIVNFLGARVSDDDVIFIVTEFCEYGSLSEVLQQNKPKLDWVKKLKWSIQTSNGMNYLHSQKPAIVHRDLKSLNLLIDKEENCKICDFGLSKSTSGESMNTFMGTLNWCAPEILLGQSFTKKADVYSMGLVLWEIIAHEKPYSGWKVLDIVEHIKNGGIPDYPSDKLVADGYKKVVESCLKRDPNDRPTFEWIEKALKTINPLDFEKNKN